MKQIKICIVEDDDVLVAGMLALLHNFGYFSIYTCSNYREATATLLRDIPDLVILDIQIKGNKDGIDLAKFIRAKLDIPFIFLTSRSDTATITRALKTHPYAYLLIPFHLECLYPAIEIALFNFNSDKYLSQRKEKKQPSALFIREGEFFHKVYFDDVVYLGSEHVYVVIHTTKKKYLVRAAMHDYIEKFDPERFVQVHRSYVVNIDKVEKVSASNLIAGGMEIPIGKNYRDEILSLLNIA